MSAMWAIVAGLSVVLILALVVLIDIMAQTYEHIGEMAKQKSDNDTGATGAAK